MLLISTCTLVFVLCQLRLSLILKVIKLRLSSTLELADVTYQFLSALQTSPTKYRYRAVLSFVFSFAWLSRNDIGYVYYDRTRHMALKLNIHRRRRREATVELSRVGVGVGSVYWA